MINSKPFLITFQFVRESNQTEQNMRFSLFEMDTDDSFSGSDKWHSTSDNQYINTMMYSKAIKAKTMVGITLNSTHVFRFSLFIDLQVIQ